MFLMYFTTITDTLDIDKPIINDNIHEQYKIHPSVIKIKQSVKPNHQFSFCKYGARGLGRNQST